MMSFDKDTISGIHIVLTILGLGNSQKHKIKNPTDTRLNGRNKWRKNGKGKTKEAFGNLRLMTKRRMKITLKVNSKVKSPSGKKWNKNECASKKKASIKEKILRETMSVNNKNNSPIRIIATLSIEGYSSSRTPALSQPNLYY